MQKFEVGDIVVLKDNTPEVTGQFTHGKEYEVEGFNDFDNHIYVKEDDSGQHNGWCSEYFELKSRAIYNTISSSNEIVEVNFRNGEFRMYDLNPKFDVPLYDAMEIAKEVWCDKHYAYQVRNIIDAFEKLGYKISKEG